VASSEVVCGRPGDGRGAGSTFFDLGLPTRQRRNTFFSMLPGAPVPRWPKPVTAVLLTLES
jgi:hypothetical protein